MTSLAPAPAPAITSPRVPESDADALLRRVASGETDGLALLYDLLSARVYGLLMNILEDATRADSVLLEIFEEVWHTCRDRVGIAGADAWVMAIALRRCRELASEGTSTRSTSASNALSQP